jgi:hypothetical protein
MVRARFPLVLLIAFGLGSCSLVVDFDPALLRDGGADTGIDASVDGDSDAAVDGGQDAG